MATIVSAALQDKAERERLLSYARDVVQPVGYSEPEFAERHAEIAEHLFDIYERELLSGSRADAASATAIASFGERRRLTRHLWWTRVTSDIRTAWHLPRAIGVLILADVAASSIWIGSDVLTPDRPLAWQISILVVFGFGTTIAYWVAASFARAGGQIVSRLLRGAPRLEWGLACGLLANAVTIFLSLRPGALANLIGMYLEHVPGWRASVEWAGVIAPLLLFSAIALIVIRSRRTPSV